MMADMMHVVSLLSQAERRGPMRGDAHSPLTPCRGEVH